ncbi:MAG: DUF3299 domain-containing protein [Gemmatimonadaceae bacterium]|jgi:hypothetical protein|nr:DUF3299 domain-containing protein [Gemmatimonadaceae bacterium]
MSIRFLSRATASVRSSRASLGRVLSSRVCAVAALTLAAVAVPSHEALRAAPTHSALVAPLPWASGSPAAVFQRTVTPFDVGLLAALDAHGAVLPGAAQDSPPIDWRVLAGLDYLSGKATDTLKKLEGRQVRVPGFVVPLDDFQEDGAEFLLVPYYGACVHTPPPPPNQIIFVQMASKKAVKLALFDAVWMHGKLKIATVESPYGTVGFTLDGLKMEPYSSR